MLFSWPKITTHKILYMHCRIVVQNERYDEWTGTIKQLRKIFYEYPKRVLSYHKRPGVKVPKAYNSTAAQGNFLETLNMTLNCKWRICDLDL